MRRNKQVRKPKLKPSISKNPFSIFSNFAGGNIKVQKIVGDQVVLLPDYRDTKGTWFYWYFGVKGGAGRTLKFKFVKENPIGVRGPAVSYDQGKTWEWLGNRTVAGPSFKYHFKGPEVRFAFTFPYVESNLLEFIANRNILVEELCKSKKGRIIERLIVGSKEQPNKILLTCRHHSCETMASFVIEGLIMEILDGDSWLKNNIQTIVIPFMDKDGVEDGDQGKNRLPHDHNRDYGGVSIHPSVLALKEYVSTFNQGEVKFALDCHCPSIRGNTNEKVFFMGGGQGKILEEVRQFSAIFERHTSKGPLKHFTKSDKLVLKGDTGMACGQWARTIPDIYCATTLETAYANVSGAIVTDVSARQLGRQLARSISEYLRKKMNTD